MSKSSAAAKLKKLLYTKERHVHYLCDFIQGGRGHWAVITLVQKFYNNDFFFIGL